MHDDYEGLQMQKQDEDEEMQKLIEEKQTLIEEQRIVIL